MITLYNSGAYVLNGTEIIADSADAAAILSDKMAEVPSKEEARKQTIAYSILKEHNTSGNMEELQIRFDKLTSHDITFVGIIQTARASGLTKFPMPYVLTNCHNSLCAVGGTINEDDHMFGLTCAKKYGGVYVPPHQAVIHQFAREMLAGGEPVGRKLDFLIQEVNRESNTIGSKCSDVQIARDVVELKAEIEKIREQVQNIE